MQRLAGKRVLMVDDDPFAVESWKLVFRGSKVDVSYAGSLQEARAALASAPHPFDAVVLDLTLPDSAGVATLKQLRQAAADVPVVVLTGDGEPATISESFSAGAQAYLVKGRADPEMLAQALLLSITVAALARRQAQVEGLVEELARRNEQLTREGAERAAILAGLNAEVEGLRSLRQTGGDDERLRECAARLEALAREFEDDGGADAGSG
jgi:DNA-binding NarL/FixJ family response regulator